MNGHIKGLLFNKEGGCYKLTDLYGLAANTSLKKVADSVGVTMLNKDSLHQYKIGMHEPLLSEDANLRLLFLKYAMEDSTKLYEIREQRIALHNQLLQQVLQFPREYLLDSTNFLGTRGALVAKLFMDFIHIKASKDVDIHLFQRAICRMGHLRLRQHKRRNKYVTDRLLLYQENSHDTKLIQKHCTPKTYSFDAINMASTPFLLTRYKIDLLSTSANVTGGALHKRWCYKTSVL